MTTLPTRDEFTGLCGALGLATYDNVIRMASGLPSDRREIERLLDDLHDAWDKLEERLAELEAMLKRLEFDNAGYCPACGLIEEHQPFCELAALLHKERITQ